MSICRLKGLEAEWSPERIAFKNQPSLFAPLTQHYQWSICLDSRDDLELAVGVEPRTRFLREVTG